MKEIKCESCKRVIESHQDLYHFQGSISPAFCSPTCMVQYLFDKGKVGVVTRGKLD